MNKDLINQIKILAEDAGPKGAARPIPVAQDKPSASKPSAVNQDAGPKGTEPVKPKYVWTGDPGIKKMQEEMQKLAGIISEQIDFDTLFRGMQNPQAANPQDAGKSLGRMSFSNFMVGSYLRDSAVKGVEFDPDPKKSKMDQKMPSDLKNMYVVLDSIKRLGPESKEFTPDGTWGPRTNNSLRNITAITDAILRLSADLDFPLKSFDASQLKDLQSLVPPTENGASLQEKIKRAPAITKHLEALSALFKEFNESVLNSPYNKQQIEGATFTSYKKKTTKTEPDMSNDEKTIHSDLVQKGNQSLYADKFNIDLGVGQPFIISAADLVSPAALEKWVNTSTYLQNWRKDPKHWNTVLQQIIKQVKQKVDEKLATTKIPEPKGI